MKKRLTLIIDGQDFSDCINRYAYSVQHLRRDGGRGGLMQDGSKTVDVLKYPVFCTLGCNDLPSSRLAQLEKACLKPYVKATVFDTSVDDEITHDFIPELSAATTRLFSGDVVWLGGMVLTLEQK